MIRKECPRCKSNRFVKAYTSFGEAGYCMNCNYLEEKNLIDKQ